ncbi:MAG TPA: class I SAM-dependent methyltransferase [Candidatus Binataceae bacterium]|nr:class I SAM-dependent methyltransferase [Candidatus Binataceae bacterium]
MIDDPQTGNWYENRDAIKGLERDNPIYTPGARFQQIAWQLALYRTLQIAAPIPGQARILDVGCGTGGAVPTLYWTRTSPNQITGIDINAEFIDRARRRFPGCNWIVWDATQDLVEPASFDLVMQSTMFLQVGEAVMESVAAAMSRAVRPGGHVLFVDWRYTYDRRVLRSSTLRQWFSDCNLVGRIPGALVPPIGRAVSAHAQWAYFLIQRTLPFLVGQYAWLFAKRHP